eukprot:jgi/Ulvmu1/5517/UM023_0053.1
MSERRIDCECCGEMWETKGRGGAGIWKALWECARVPSRAGGRAQACAWRCLCCCFHMHALSAATLGVRFLHARVSAVWQPCLCSRHTPRHPSQGFNTFHSTVCSPDGIEASADHRQIIANVLAIQMLLPMSTSTLVKA